MYELFTTASPSTSNWSPSFEQSEEKFKYSILKKNVLGLLDLEVNTSNKVTQPNLFLLFFSLSFSNQT